MPEEKASKPTKTNSSDLIAVLEPYFTKQAPFQIPEPSRKLIVQWLPWINLVLGIILLPLVLVVLGLGAILGALAPALGVGTGIFYWLSLFVLAISIALLFITFPGLQARKLSAWKLVFWADIAYFVYSILTGLNSPAALISNLLFGGISLVVGLFILFQIKSHFK